MTRNLLRAGALSCALLTSTALCTSPVLAQTAPPPRFQEVDANGVDLVSGRFVFGITEGSIGSGPGAVSIQRSQRNDYGRTDQWSGLLYQRAISGTPHMVVQFGGRSDTFTISGGTFTSTKANGATLTGGSGSYTYTAPDGTTVSYTAVGPDIGYPMSGPGCNVGDPGTCAIPQAVTRPDGTVFTLDWTILERCHQYDEELSCLQPAAYFRFEGVTSSTGYTFDFNYSSNSAGSNSSAPPSNWYVRTGATFNNTVNPISSPPSVSYSGSQVTDTGGGTWTITEGSGITGVRRPGSTSDDISISYGTGGVVSSVTRDGITTNYSRSVSGNTATTTITDALSQVTTVVADLSKERVTSVTDPLSRTTSFTYDSNSRLTRVTEPEGNYTERTYDARGNVTQTQRVAKSGSGTATLTETASFDSSCLTPVTCNRPNSITDARGNSTDFTYDSTHGGVLSVTAPAPTSGATRPQTRYAYTLSNGEYRLTSVSACSSGTSSACVGTANESRMVIGYDSQGHVNSFERRDGTGGLSATATATYTRLGDIETVDGPLSGAADTIRVRYNAARQAVGVIGPDPDGSGSLTHRAVRTTYRSDGLPTRLERGNVASQSDTHWAAFSASEEVETDYNGNDRPVVQRLKSGSTVHALTQTSYDALGRPECVAQRMNPSEFGSLPSSACTLDTEGSSGPDRLVKTTFDAVGQITVVQSGYGVSGVQADEVTSAFTSNGRVSHVTDGEGNRTTYEYDGQDRLVKTRFPSPTTDGTSSTTDYEQLTLDANGNATSRRLRDGNSIGFTFDALDRATGKDLPGGEPDVTYAYDLLGRQTSAATSSQTLSFTFDALGRNLTQSGPQGTGTSTFDVAGRRTRLTYPGSGLYVDYDYSVTGEMTHIRENGATSGVGVLATFAYDDLGRRTSLTRGNGTVTSYSFDTVSRLDELAQNLSGTTNDLTLEFTHNPASQIVSNVRSNDSYSFTGVANQNVADTHNGLNQLTGNGSTSVSHDTRGNISAIGSSSYGYSSENMLTSGPGSVTLSYDPLLRLYQATGSSTNRFAYDGLALIAEHDGSSNLQRRYVHGPRVDEPLVWYEGSGTSDRRFLHADERGSIIATSNSAGTITGTINRYDEYGQPQGTMNGRFGYTGQTWLADLGLWHYKARMYWPGGRFMQTDPIGFDAGMNLYAYVDGDPVNLSDPLGLAGCPPTPDPDDIEVCGRRIPPKKKAAAPDIFLDPGPGDESKGPRDNKRQPSPLDCGAAARQSEGERFICNSPTGNSGLAPPPRELTPEERREAKCKANSHMGNELSLLGGGLLAASRIPGVGVVALPAGAAVTVFSAALAVDNLMNGC